jgi:NOL1/NOP2/sun family putative RNA methylase
VEARIQEYIKKHEGLFLHSPTARAVELAEKYGFLSYMTQRYIEFMHEEVEEFLESCSYPLKKAIRCNTLKVKDCTRLEKSLKGKGFELTEVGWIPYFYWVEKSPDRPSLGATLEYLNGLYYIQSPVSGVPVVELEPQRDEIVLDMAAAPGGKTSFISQLMNNKGTVVAVEKSRERMKSLLSNLSRLGVNNVVLIRQPVEKLVKIFSEYFDKILLDAPCSGEGLIPIDMSRRTKTSPDDLKKFFETQLNLIDSAYRMLKPGGSLVYSTCSIAPEENEFVVEYLLENYSVKIEALKGFYPAKEGLIEYRGYKLSEELKRCVRFYPHVSKTEGFFVCRVKKES